MVSKKVKHVAETKLGDTPSSSLVETIKKPIKYENQFEVLRQ